MRLSFIRKIDADIDLLQDHIASSSDEYCEDEDSNAEDYYANEYPDEDYEFSDLDNSSEQDLSDY